MQTKKMEDEDICQVDLYVKSRVLKDTILLAKKKNFAEFDSFNSLSQIYSNES